MPHYVRFLKPPRVDKAGPGSGSVRALVTLTTDLGDSFLAEEVQLVASVLVSSSSSSSSSTASSSPSSCSNVGTSYVQCIKQKSLLWKSDTRQIPITVDDIGLDLHRHSVVLRVGPPNDRGPDDDFVTASGIPLIISAWSPPFGGSRPVQAEKLVLRRLRTRCPTEIRVWEETGNNLARHIWDASLAWLMLFQETLTPAEGTPAAFSSLMFKDLFRQKHDDLRFNVIELGAGCGIVGIALAQFMSNCSVLLTDLEEVREIVNRNIGASTPTAGSVVKFHVLDWDKSIPGQVSAQQYDLIVVSDCTYNSDSLPALVDTMATLVEHSPQAAIIVALKRRHESESVFFELMQLARLEMHDKACIRLPCAHPEECEVENIEVYYFRLSTAQG